MPLTDTATRHARPLDKPYKLSDAQGLYLLIECYFYTVDDDFAEVVLKTYNKWSGSI